MEKSIELLEKCVSIYSPSGNEKTVAEFLVSEMANLGFQAFVDEAGNAVGETGNGKKTILMVGHIDTVKGFIPVKIEGSRMSGRGSVDAKGPFCSFVMAASKADLADKRIIVVGAVEEESASSKGARHLIGKYNPDFIVIGEPSGVDSITLGYKGRLLIEYIMEKDMSHTASGNAGVIEEAFSFYSRLKKHSDDFNKEKKGIFESLQLSIRDINSSSDGFRDSVKMMLAYRLPVGFDLEKLKEKILRINENAKIRFYGEEKAIASGKNNSLVRAFLSSIRKNDLTPKFKYKTGTSDMNVLGHAFQEVPILAYGPGDSSLDHTPDEHIDLDEYRKAIEIIKNMLSNL